MCSVEVTNIRGTEKTGLETRETADIRKNDGPTAAFCGRRTSSLKAFINGVEALRGEKIPEADADELIAAGEEIICLLKAP